MATFLYNENTDKLHIKGGCYHSKSEAGFKVFHSEQEALAYDGRAVSMCKICQKRREEERREVDKK